MLITGGTGFVGSALVRALAEQGRSVHVLARPTSRREHLADLPVAWHAGDLGDPGSIARALRAAGPGADVVHAAARIDYRRAGAARTALVNVEGTRHVLLEARAHGVRRLCFVSSVVAVGTAPDARRALDEGARWNSARLRCAYVSSKRASEELVLEAAEELDVVAVLPGAVFGPAPEPSNTARFLARAARGRGPLLVPPGSLAVVGVEDVADGIRLALERGIRGRRYLLVESSWTHARLARRVLDALGSRRRVVRVPRLPWRLVCRAAAGLDRLRPLELLPPQALRLLGEHYRFEATRAREELGWSPRPFDEVLAGTLAWMRASDLLGGAA